MAVRPTKFQKQRQKEDLSLFQAVRRDRRERKEEAIARKEAERKRRKAVWEARQEILRRKVVTMDQFDERLAEFFEAVEGGVGLEHTFDVDREVFIFSVVKNG